MRLLPDPFSFQIFKMTIYGASIVILGCQSTPSAPLDPNAAIGSFELADPDLEIKLVASEPLVQDPVAMAFDVAGNIWVVEMLSFMMDINGTGEEEKIGRVSVLFDDNDDGEMDRSQIFLDSLHLPRALALVNGGVLVAEQMPLWFVKDTNGDFRADTKVLVDSNYGGLAMPEHSSNGLWRGLDGWYYNAKSKSRYKEISGSWVEEQTEFRGQWGICHDDAGRLIYNYNWSQLHADLVPPNYLQRNPYHQPSSGIDHGLTLDRKIFPIRSNTAVNRGYVPGTLDKNERLLEFASACAPFIYRGNLLPPRFKGNAFVCEPTANLIKCNKISEDGFMLSASGVYQKKEFLASTDERFRPIFLADGPDGALYIVDMYRGIIQHGPYMTDYLREVSLERGLDKHIHLGRIWKIKPKATTTDSWSRLDQLSVQDLIKQLGNDNGWIRDRAQQLLSQEKDPEAIPLLVKLLGSGNEKARLHSLWTLEALGVISADFLIPVLENKDAVVAQTALRLLYDKSYPEVFPKKTATLIQDLFTNAHPLLQMQIILSANLLPEDLAIVLSKLFLTMNSQNPIARDVVMSSLVGREMTMLKHLMKDQHWQIQNQDREIFYEVLATAITNHGEPNEMRYLLFLLFEGNNNPGWIYQCIANGMINHQRSKDSPLVTLEEEPVFSRIKDSTTYLAPYESKIKSLFSWPGKPEVKSATNDQPQKIDQRTFAAGRQKYLNLCASCHGTQGEGMRRFAPPLQNSEWVVGEKNKLAMILLHGMEGPIVVNGTAYDVPDILPVMPSFSTLQNNDISAISTYIRNAWGHHAEPLNGRLVGHIRYRTQGKITPWSAVELDSFVFDQNL